MSPVIWQWGAEHVLVVIVVLAALVILPPQFAVGRRKVDQLERDERSVLLDASKNVELTTLARSYGSRIAHLITKADDVSKGEVNDRYIAHTLSAAREYFKERAMHSRHVDADERVELVLYRANWAGNGRNFFDRQTQTHTETNEFPYKLTSFQNPSGVQLIKQLVEKNHFYAVSDDDVAEVRQAFDIAEDTPFKQFVGVPVYKTRKQSHQSNIVGMVLMMSTRDDMLREPDYRLLATYAWFIAAAKAFDSL
jgi:hypothetical protein